MESQVAEGLLPSLQEELKKQLSVLILVFSCLSSKICVVITKKKSCPKNQRRQAHSCCLCGGVRGVVLPLEVSFVICAGTQNLALSEIPLLKGKKCQTASRLWLCRCNREPFHQGSHLIYIHHKKVLACVYINI